MATPDPRLLARHWRQLRETRGTVLLGPARSAADARLDPGWFLDGCPLEPEAALEALRARHGFPSREAALAALHAARDVDEALRSALSDLPAA